MQYWTFNVLYVYALIFNSLSIRQHYKIYISAIVGTSCIFTICSVCDVGDMSTASKSLDDHLKSILENVRLVYLLEREGWDATPNWEDILSLGEQQRLGMVSD
jgi:hypothetical protein